MSSFQDQLEQAMADLAQQRAQLGVLQQRLAELECSATSKKRTVTITVNASAEVTRVKFQGTGYRALPPAELEQLLVDTIAQAREQCALQQAAVISEVMPGRLPAEAMLTGEFNLDEMIDDAVRLVSGLPQPEPDQLNDLVGAVVNDLETKRRTGHA